MCKKGYDNSEEGWNKEFRRKKKIKCKEIAFWRSFTDFFIYLKKSNLQKNTEKNICESISYEDDLVKFS